MSVDNTSITKDIGLNDEEEKAAKEESRWAREFEKKRTQCGQEAGQGPPSYTVKVEGPPQPPAVSSGFTVAEMERQMREAEERKAKNAADALAQKKAETERINKQLNEARIQETKPAPKFDQMPKEIENKSGKDFITLRVEQFFPHGAEKPQTPSWITTELMAGKSKKFAVRVLEQFNFVRQHPKLFADRLREISHMIEPHLANQAKFTCPELHADEILKEGRSGFDELIEYLDKLDPMPPLTLETGLSTACMDLTEIQGPKGLEGLEGETAEERKQRFFRYIKTTGGIASQIMSYGPFMPVHVVLHMLLDDGQPERKKRLDILNPEWRVVGIHAGRHSKKTFMCVCLFAHGLL